MKVIQLRIRCSKNPEKHAKLVKFPDARFSRELVEDLARIMCGTSSLLVFPPGPNSPIGKCAVCGASGLTYTIKEVVVAEPEK